MVRLSRNVIVSGFLDLCDEMGLLVWEEAHARGLQEEQMRNPNFMPQTRQCVREMVAQHRNHPSIFIWGCLNECADNCDYGADCYREVIRPISIYRFSLPSISTSAIPSMYLYIVQ